jgi:4'-phosphopantetheinyl transferase
MWHTPTFFPTLMPGEVHVWLADVRKFEYIDSVWQTAVTPDEWQQFQKIVVTREREARLVARALLRQWIAEYLQTDPLQLIFSANAQGKPFLQGSHLQFNVSHSGHLIVIAFCLEAPVGIDVEVMQKAVDIAAVAGRVFDPDICRQLQQLPMAKQGRAFFQLWTALEAYVKGLGSGLASLKTLKPNDLTIYEDSSRDHEIITNAIPPWTIFRLGYDNESSIALAMQTGKKICKWLYRHKLSI